MFLVCRSSDISLTFARIYQIFFVDKIFLDYNTKTSLFPVVTDLLMSEAVRYYTRDSRDIGPRDTRIRSEIVLTLV